MNIENILNAYNKLREKGLKQVQQFQWKYTAEKVYNIYRGLLEKKKEK